MLQENLKRSYLCIVQNNPVSKDLILKSKKNVIENQRTHKTNKFDIKFPQSSSMYSSFNECASRIS